MIEHRLKRAVGRAGITREQGAITWHDLRHTYGSHLAMRGILLKVIQELMGHVTVDMTMGYAHLSPDARERAVQALDRPMPQAHAVPSQPRWRGTWGAHDGTEKNKSPATP